MDRYRWAIRLHDGRYVYADGDSIDEALRSVGVARKEMKRYMPVKWLDKPAMSAEVKARLRAINEQKRAQRKSESQEELRLF